MRKARKMHTVVSDGWCAMKKFYTVDELADASGVSVGTIRNRIKDGTLFAVQSKDRGAFRIPVGAYQRYLAGLGLAPAVEVSLTPRTKFHEMGPSEIHELHIAPVLEQGGFADMPELLRAVEAEPPLWHRYRDAIEIYQTYLQGMATATIVPSRAAGAVP